MSVVIVTRSAGLVGGETGRFFSNQELGVVGIENGMRQYFLGEKP